MVLKFLTPYTNMGGDLGIFGLSLLGLVCGLSSVSCLFTSGVYRFWVLMSGLIGVRDSVLWCILFPFITCCHPCLCARCVTFSSSVVSFTFSTSLVSVQKSTSLSYLLFGAEDASCCGCAGVTKGLGFW